MPPFALENGQTAIGCVKGKVAMKIALKIRHCAEIAAILVSVFGAGIAVPAQANELTLTCAPLIANQSNLGFNAWIDLASSKVIMAWFEVNTPNVYLTSTYPSGVWPEATGSITYSGISWSEQGGHMSFSIDRSNGRGVQNNDGWVINYSCNPTSVAKPAMKF